MTKEISYTKCPNCGKRAIVESEANRIRNIIRDHLKCTNCRFEKVMERPPDVTVGDWIR
jgi:predicted RNA-binding Zn-ribbon protein involved in translation (DUF1610 family)